MSALKKHKIITEVTTEPINLTEVKAHLRINNFLDNNNEVENTLISKEYVIGTYQGTGIDILNKTSKVIINVGECIGNCTFSIQESDNNINFYNWYTFDLVNSSNDNQIYTKEYNGTKQYIRVYVIVATGECIFSASISIDNFDLEDEIINNYIKSAREFGEDYTGHAFAEQTIDKYLDYFPNDNNIMWDYNPLQEVTYVKYKNADGQEITLTEDVDYAVDLVEGCIYTPPNVIFPTTQLWTRNAISIRGVCGYETEKIPKNFKHAMLLHTGMMYKYRDEKIPLEDLNTVYRFYNMRRVRWF